MLEAVFDAHHKTLMDYVQDRIVDKSIIGEIYDIIRDESAILSAYLITVAFLRDCQGIDSDIKRNILDNFYERFPTNFDEKSVDDFWQTKMQMHYKDYEPRMREDFHFMGQDKTILFRRVTGYFLGNIGSEYFDVSEILFFGSFILSSYTTICKGFDELKKYKIG